MVIPSKNRDTSVAAKLQNYDIAHASVMKKKHNSLIVQGHNHEYTTGSN